MSAFNNAGFSTHADSVMGYQSDPLILVPIMLAVILTALGFPVMQDLRDKRFDWRRWSLHSKVTVWGTAALLALGFGAILAMEWSNAETLGPMGVGASCSTLPSMRSCRAPPGSTASTSAPSRTRR